MPETKRLVCLANSRKLSGRCIAGREIAGERVAGWIRPVSVREHEEVSEYERQYEDGSDPRVMDIVDIPLLEPRPTNYQQENWLLDPNQYWTKAGHIGWHELERMVDPTEPLWTNGNSTSSGRNDRISLVVARELQSSLRLIHIEALTLSVFVTGAAFGNPRRRVQGRFRYHESDYWLWVTDPDYERKYLAKPDGIHTLGESCLTVSLGEPFQGDCYKLIAAIIERDM